MSLDLSHIDAWVFDLDDTLYPPEQGLMTLIQARINAFMVDAVGLPAEEAKVLQRQFLNEHGTTLAGLMANYAVDPEKFLHEVAKRFGISDTEFAYIKARHVTAAKRNPYDVLGIEPSISNDGLKSHYRKLVADNHPDKLIARGVPFHDRKASCRALVLEARGLLLQGAA